MVDRTFVLGAGAQKAGTTWLYSYLKASPAFAAGYRKEYHVFDSLDLESEWRSKERIISLAEEALRDAREGRSPDAAVLHRMSMYADPRFYFEYFTNLVTRRPAKHVTADLTPSYALLGADRMRQIREGFAKRGVRTVAIFLMRDPVDRIWSQVRMQKDRQPDRMVDPSEELLLERYALPAYDSRSRYDRTIETLDAVFGADEVHYGFYESLFTLPAVQAVCDLVGVEAHPPELDVRRNAVPATTRLPESTERTVAEHFRGVYETVQARFPHVDLTELWPSARHVL